MMKNSFIQIRVSTEEKELIRSRAKQAHLEMSEWILQSIIPNPQAKFLSLLARLKRVQDSKERNFVINEIAVFLHRLSSEELHRAVSNPLEVGLNNLMDNYIAAMIEQTCVAKKIIAPVWLSEKTGVAEPFFGVEFFAVRLYLLSVSPPSFRKRNIFIDASIGDLV